MSHKSFKTTCPSCGTPNRLMVIAVTFQATGQRAEFDTVRLESDGFGFSSEMPEDSADARVEPGDNSTENERVRCNKCLKEFDLKELIIPDVSEKTALGAGYSLRLNDPLKSGWDIFECGPVLRVQRGDEASILADDEAAIKAARALGVPCNIDGLIEDDVEHTCLPGPDRAEKDAKVWGCPGCLLERLLIESVTPRRGYISLTMFDGNVLELAFCVSLEDARQKALDAFGDLWKRYNHTFPVPLMADNWDKITEILAEDSRHQWDIRPVDLPYLS